MPLTLENRNGRIVAVDDQGNEQPIQLGDTVHDSVNTDTLKGGWDYLATTADELVDIVNNQAGVGDTIAVTGGTFSYSTTLLFDYDGFSFKGVGKGETVLEYTGTGNGVEVKGGSGNVTGWLVKDLSITTDTNGSGSNGLHVENASQGDVERVDVDGFGDDGVFNTSGNTNKYEKCRVQNNSGNGISLESTSSDTTIEDCTVTDNGVHGIKIEDSSACRVRGGNVEKNAGLGVYINVSSGSVNGATLADVFLDSNLQSQNANHIKISVGVGTLRGVDIRGCKVNGNGASDGNTAVGVEGGAGINITACGITNVDTAVSDNGASPDGVHVHALGTSSVNTVTSLANATNVSTEALGSN
jgi:parallel beta-helix repeat protein